MSRLWLVGARAAGQRPANVTNGKVERDAFLNILRFESVSPVRGVVASDVTGAVTARGRTLELLGPAGIRAATPDQ